MFEKRMQRFHPMEVTRDALFGCTVGFLCMILLTKGEVPLHFSSTDYLLLIGLASVATVLPIILLFVAIAKIGAANATLISTLEPVFALLLSWSVLRDIYSVWQLLGAILIVASVSAVR